MQGKTNSKKSNRFHSLYDDAVKESNQTAIRQISQRGIGTDAVRLETDAASNAAAAKVDLHFISRKGCSMYNRRR